MMLSTEDTAAKAAALLQEIAEKRNDQQKWSETSQSDCGADPDAKSCLTTTGQGHFLYQTLGFGLGQGGRVYR